MKQIFALFAFSMSLVGCIGASSSQVISVSADLTPSSGISSNGTARVSSNFTIGDSSISVFGSFSNLTSSITAVTVKAPNRTCNLDIVDTSPDRKSGRISGVCAGGLTTAEVDQFKAGLFKVTISSANFPNGELFGVIRQQ
jgi:hypothetical protein